MIAGFFGKLAWDNPLTYFTILGALGAVDIFLRVWRWCQTFWNTSLVQFRHPAVFKDFYFTTRELGYHMLEDGNTFLNVRRETVVSMIKELKSIPVYYTWSGSGEITEEIQPSALKIEDREKVVGKPVAKTAGRKSIVFEKPLHKREKLAFIWRLRCVVREHQPEPFLSSSSTRRVDQLILRVAFPPHKPPRHVTYRVLDGDGFEKSHSTLECSDYLTGEYRVEIKYPRPFYEHRIEWDYGS